jgi:hypothetical protein
MKLEKKILQSAIPDLNVRKWPHPFAHDVECIAIFILNLFIYLLLFATFNYN